MFTVMLGTMLIVSYLSHVICIGGQAFSSTRPCGVMGIPNRICNPQHCPPDTPTYLDRQSVPDRRACPGDVIGGQSTY